MKIALSTSWNAFRHKKAAAMITEIKELGFEDIELSFNLTKEIVDGIYRQAGEGRIKISSLHNYCPIPDGIPIEKALPDCYSIASLDEEQRQSGVKYTKITIETARRLKAKAVVLHCGRVETQDYTRDLIALYNYGGLNSPQAEEIKNKMQKERGLKLKPHLGMCLKSLEELAGFAQKLDIKLGIENRFYYREIPSYEEIDFVLKHFKGTNIYYWHDTGHAQLWENLGFIKHQECLKNYSSRLLGLHLHEIEATDDHKAPTPKENPREDNVDFNMLKKYIKDDIILVIEAHYPAQAKEIISAKKYLEGLL